MTNNKIKRKPDWLKIRLPHGENFEKVNQIVKSHGLHTICSSGNCPNQGECWGLGTATFLILGNVCTRACRFCAVETGRPDDVDLAEPENIAKSVELMNLKHCVLTSVTRDDLTDGGAKLWAETIKAIKNTQNKVTIEALVSDFGGNLTHLDKVIAAAPEVISHNLETVRRLTPKIRTRAKYDTSLEVIEHIAKSSITAKSGIMLGLGETREEVLETMEDLRRVGCTIITIGQYLQPTRLHAEVCEYVHPFIFKEYERIGIEKGFSFVESSPLVRSSYHAEKHVK